MRTFQIVSLLLISTLTVNPAIAAQGPKGKGTDTSKRPKSEKFVGRMHKAEIQLSGVEYKRAANEFDRMRVYGPIPRTVAAYKRKVDMKRTHVRMKNIDMHYYASSRGIEYVPEPPQSAAPPLPSGPAPGTLAPPQPKVVDPKSFRPPGGDTKKVVDPQI